MVLASILLAVAQGSPVQVFDDCVAATRGATAASFTADVLTKAQGKEFHNVYTVKYRQPGTLFIRVHALKTGSQPASDRSYLINGTKLVAMDADSGEYLTRQFTGKKNLAERAVELLGALDDSVRFQLVPDDLAKFFGDFKKLKDWVYSPYKNGPVLQRVVVGKSNVKFEFDKHTWLRTVRISAPSSLLSWSYKYNLAPKAISMAIPSSYKKVDSFLAVNAPIARFKTAAASRLWDQAIRAYSHLTAASMIVSNLGQSTRVIFSGTRAMQKQDGLTWSFDGHALSLVRNGHFMRGQVPPSLIPAKVGSDIEPTLQAWALHKNPARALSSQQLTVRLAGIVKIGGVTCDLVEFSSLTTQVSVLVRRTDHLFARVTSESKDAKGRRLSGLDREITYTTINRPIPASAFVLKPATGQAVEKLP